MKSDNQEETVTQVCHHTKLFGRIIVAPKVFCVSAASKFRVNLKLTVQQPTRRNTMTVNVTHSKFKSGCAPSESHNDDTNNSLFLCLIVLVVSIAAAVAIVSPKCALDPRDEKSLVRDNDGSFQCRRRGGNEG